MRRILQLLLILVAVGASSGCAVNRATAMVDPMANLEKIRSVHVTKLDKDERGINVLIADKLKERGLQVTTGPGKRQGVDANVTYADRWTWDITMYMVELTVVIRDSTDYPLATGNSFHTSLTRKSPKEMVDEVVDNIFNKGKGA